MIYTDRIENGIIIGDSNGKKVEIPLSEVNGNVREGDVLVMKNGAYATDEKATAERRSEMNDLQDSLWDD